MGCSNTTEKRADQSRHEGGAHGKGNDAFINLARENPVAAKLKEEWSRFVRSAAHAPSETKVDVWANKDKEPLTHRSVDQVGKLFLVHVRNDLTNHGWTGNFDYSVVGVEGQGFIKATVDVDPRAANNTSSRIFWEAKVHYISTR